MVDLGIYEGERDDAGLLCCHGDWSAATQVVHFVGVDCRHLVIGMLRRYIAIYQTVETLELPTITMLLLPLVILVGEYLTTAMYAQHIESSR